MASGAFLTAAEELEDPIPAQVLRVSLYANTSEEYKAYTLAQADELVKDKGGEWHSLQITVLSLLESYRQVSLKIDLAETPSELLTLDVQGGRPRKKDRVLFEPGPEPSKLGSVYLRNLKVGELGSLLRSSNLHRLSVDSCSLQGQHLPEELWGSNLSDLVLSGTRTRRLPAGIENSEMLMVLDISRTGLEVLPEGISQLENLTNVDCENNKLETIPVLGSSLEMGSFSRNRISEIPEWALDRRCLLWLDGNPVRHTFAAADFDTNSLGTGVLDLSCNQISVVPPWANCQKPPDSEEPEGESNVLKVSPFLNAVQSQ